MYFVLDINVIRGCNLNCSYCFENDNEFEYITSKTLKSIDKFIKNIFKSNWFNKNISNQIRSFDGLLLQIWGGEPSLNFHAIKHLLEKYKNSQFIEFIIFTNGVFFNKELKEYLKNYESKHKLKIQISYDGQFLQEKNRPHKKNINVTKDIFKNIEFLNSIRNRYYN